MRLGHALADRQDAGQLTVQVGIQPGSGRGGRQDDAVDHHAHQLHGLRAIVTSGQRAPQRLDLAAVQLRQVGVQQNCEVVPVPRTGWRLG